MLIAKEKNALSAPWKILASLLLLFVTILSINLKAVIFLETLVLKHCMFCGSKSKKKY